MYDQRMFHWVNDHQLPFAGLKPQLIKLISDLFGGVMVPMGKSVWDPNVNDKKLSRILLMGKAVFGLLETALMTAIEMGAAALLGQVHGYTEAFPTAQFVDLAVCTFAVEAMLFFSELLLMIRFGNPMTALCVGIVGALLGVFSAFMPRVVSYFVPWGYFEPLSAYEVAEWNRETHFVRYDTHPWNWVLLLFTAALGLAFFALAWRRVQREEV